MKKLRGVRREQGINFMPTVFPESIEIRRQSLANTHRSDAFTASAALEVGVLVDRKLVRFILPKKDRPRLRWRVGTAIDCALEHLYPYHVSQLPDLAPGIEWVRP